MRIFTRPTRRVLNCTQHWTSTEQLEEGVEDLPLDLMAAIRAAITFDLLPTEEEIEERCARVVGLLSPAYPSPYGRLAYDEDPWDPTVVTDNHWVLIGGAPFLMGPLTAALKKAGYRVLFAFSKRVSEEDKTGRKMSIFRHIGFVES